MIISHQINALNLLIVEVEDQLSVDDDHGSVDDDPGSVGDDPGNVMDDVEQSINVPIAIDELYNLIICKGCGVAILFNWIVSHLREKHGIKTHTAEVMRFLNMMRPSMTSTEADNWIKSTWVARAIQNIPLRDGYSCSICQHSGCKMKGMRNHFTDAHRGMKASKNVTKCKVQQVFTGGL